MRRSATDGFTATKSYEDFKHTYVDTEQLRQAESVKSGTNLPNTSRLRQASLNSTLRVSYCSPWACPFVGRTHEPSPGVFTNSSGQGSRTSLHAAAPCSAS